MAYCQPTIALVARSRIGRRLGESCDPPLALALSRARMPHMEYPALRGRSILIVEDEPLIGMDIRLALEDAGAFVTATTTIRHALLLVEHDNLAGAIMDHALADGDSTTLCHRLKARGIPYVSYSGYDPVKGADFDAPWVQKPASMYTLLGTLAALLEGQPERVS